MVSHLVAGEFNIRSQLLILNFIIDIVQLYRRDQKMLQICLAVWLCASEQ